MLLTIEHTPIAKKRPRFCVIAGHAKAYDVQSKEKRETKWHFASQMREKGLSMLPKGPIGVKMRVYTKKPKSLSKRKREALSANGGFNSKKPDIDNYIKFYFDILSGIAYEDDNLIASLECQKVYSDTPRVEIDVHSLGEQDD